MSKNVFDEQIKWFVTFDLPKVSLIGDALVVLLKKRAAGCFRD